MLEIGIDHIQLSQLASGLFDAGHSLRFSAPGSSMYPFIWHRDTIEIQPRRDKLPRMLDILLYVRSNGRLVAHRVARVERRRAGVKIFMRGDALPFHQEEITLEQVLGQVVATERAGRRFNLDSLSMRSLAWLWVACMPISSYALRLSRYFLRIARGWSKGIFLKA